MKPAMLLFLAVGSGVGVYALTRKSTAAATGSTPPKALLPAPVVTQVSPPLDTGLSSDEKLAVQKALTKEVSASNLLGFASTFDPMFPLATAALQARAHALTAPVTSGAGLSGDACCHGCQTGEGDCDDMKPPLLTETQKTQMGIDIH